MPNRLIHETSPYLLQHAHNPVDWHPWGNEAFLRARSENKPIFLSIGYAACHWCHVMERESFENASIAAFLNEHFVSIKVDREERPDVDQVYMQAVLAMRGGQGGWPLSVFLTPDGNAFFGGTYWPPESRMGMPGFDHVLERVNHAFQNQPDQIVAQSQEVTNWLRQRTDNTSRSKIDIDGDLLYSAVEQLSHNFDFEWGGFGGAPKFPHSMHLDFLLRMATFAGQGAPRLEPETLFEMVRLNLDAMACGGIYDHLGGGFARYSVDERWLVPHFEKMLYDNALLVPVYCNFFQLTGAQRFAEVARETLDYLLRDMQDPTGGFHSSEDADSEGIEGKFYVWTEAEVVEILGQEPAIEFGHEYGVTKHGNFEGHNILYARQRWELLNNEHVPPIPVQNPSIAENKQKLLDSRNRRVRPGKDDKVLTSWNGLAISAFAIGGVALGEVRYLDAARRIARFIREKMTDANGRLLHTFRAGRAKQPAFLDDYANLINGLLDLYEVEFDESLVDWSVALIDEILTLFGDDDGGALYFTGKDQPQLIARMKDQHDSSVPSGNSMAAWTMLRLSSLIDRPDLRSRAESIISSTGDLMKRAPLAVGQMLNAAWLLLQAPTQLVLISPNYQMAREALDVINSRPLPCIAIALRIAGEQKHRSKWLDPLFQSRNVSSNQPTLYVCRGRTCQPPAVGLEQITSAISQLAHATAAGTNPEARG